MSGELQAGLNGSGRARKAIMERETGFEPATSTLARLHSTTELLPLNEERLLRHSPAPCQARFLKKHDGFPQDVAWCGFAGVVHQGGCGFPVPVGSALSRRLSRRAVRPSQSRPSGRLNTACGFCAVASLRSAPSVTLGCVSQRLPTLRTLRPCFRERKSGLAPLLLSAG